MGDGININVFEGECMNMERTAAQTSRDFEEVRRLLNAYSKAIPDSSSDSGLLASLIPESEGISRDFASWLAFC